MGLFPCAGDEAPERRDSMADLVRLVLAPGFRRERMALAANLLDRLQLRLTEEYPAGPTAGVAQEYPAPPTGRSNPDAETGNARVPDRIFPLAGAMAGDGGVGKPHAFLACHPQPSSTAPTVSAASRTIASARWVYLSVVSGFR